MPKKQPKNAFFFFMCAYMKREQNRGRRFPNGLADVSAPASDEWNKMTPQQRGHYDAQAKNAKYSNAAQEATIYTSHGVNYAHLERAREEREVSKQAMCEEITQLVGDAFLDNSIAHRPFYFIAANHFCKTMTDNRYVPAELAILRYTLADGCTRKLHTFVNPAELPAGYAFEAMELSRKTHRLPPPPNARGERDLARICADVMRFIGGPPDEAGAGAGGCRLPPLFADTRNGCEDNLRAMRSICQQLSDAAAGSARAEQLRVYPLVKLFHALRNAAARDAVTEATVAFPSEAVAQAMLDRDHHDHRDEIACAFHRELDRASFCALSQVTRYAYTLSDHLCLDLGLDLKAGAHAPADADVAGAKAIKAERDGAAFEGKCKRMAPSLEKEEEEDEEKEVKCARPRVDDDDGWSVAGPVRNKHVKKERSEHRHRR